MLKQDLIDAYKEVMLDNKFTYREVCKLSGLSQSQLANVLNHDGKKVSVDKMVDGLLNLGFGIKLDFYNIEEE